ncbi:MAG: hypothetical protein RIF46_10800 [Cyclobacteriaceae bacterium]
MVDLTEHERRTLELMEHMKFAEGESDRGYVLFLAAQADEYLKRILQAFLVEDELSRGLFEGAFAPFHSLDGKTRAAFAMGLISRDEMAQIQALRKVRNIFAHSMDASFESVDVVKICSKPPVYCEWLCSRDAFLHMAMNIVLPLLYREILVRKQWKRMELSRSEANS